MAKKYDVFLSYSQQDQHIASDLAAKMEALHLNCFMAPMDIGSGEQWERAIREALLQSEHILVLITPRSKNSKWVLMECGAAWVQEKTLMPLTQFVEPEEFVSCLRGFQGRVIETDAQVRSVLEEISNIVHPDEPLQELTFAHIVAKLKDIGKTLRLANFSPDVVIGSGRGGAICAAIFASTLGKRRLKVVDCEFKGVGDSRSASIDNSSLQEKDICDKNILVVEWARRKGQVFRLIEQKLNELKPAGIQWVAMFWTRESEPGPDFVAFDSQAVPLPPWLG